MPGLGGTSVVHHLACEENPGDPLIPRPAPCNIRRPEIAEGGRIMAVKQDTLWFGYLNAGKKGSLVVRDSTLDTGTSTTIYLFNQKKGKILEYRRDIVEPKLRALTEKETAGVEALAEAFERARSGFVPRVARRPVSLPPARKKRREEEAPEVEIDDEAPVPFDDEEEDEEGPEPVLDEADED